MSVKKINLPNFAETRPIKFEGYVIITLDSKWLELLEDDIKFLVSIKNNQLTLTAKLNSQKIQSIKKC